MGALGQRGEQAQYLLHTLAAAFDEGGARGLLMNHLGLQAGCEMVFDLHDSVENCAAPPAEDEAVLVDTLWRQLSQPRKTDWHAGV